MGQSKTPTSSELQAQDICQAPDKKEGQLPLTSAQKKMGEAVCVVMGGAPMAASELKKETKNDFNSTHNSTDDEIVRYGLRPMRSMARMKSLRPKFKNRL